MKIFDGLYAFIWQDYRENNCNTYFIDRDKKILIDPGHDHLFGHVEQGLGQLGVPVSAIDYVLITHGHPDHLEAAAEALEFERAAALRDEIRELRHAAAPGAADGDHRRKSGGVSRAAYPPRPCIR